jgi:hypothetical protein
MNEAREAIMSLMKEPPCKNCTTWDYEGNYCFGTKPNCHLADSILNLRGDGWRIAVVKTEGELPKTSIQWIALKAQRDMLKAGWVQEVK